MATLTFSVGKGGVNHHGDVVNLQEFLNGVPPRSGGPIHKLPINGIFTKATEQALNDYHCWHQSFAISGASGNDKEKEAVLLPGGIDLGGSVSFPKCDAGSKSATSLSIKQPGSEKYVKWVETTFQRRK
jgi:hypothetical protein